MMLHYDKLVLEQVLFDAVPAIGLRLLLSELYPLVLKATNPRDLVPDLKGDSVPDC